MNPPVAGISAFISPGRSLETTLERATLADRLGYDAAYTTHIAGRGWLTVAMAYAPASERLRLGTGVVPIFSRTPATMAQTAATIDETPAGAWCSGSGSRTGSRSRLARPEDHQAGDPDARIHRRRAGDPRRHRAARLGFFPTKFAFMGYEARAELPIYVAALSPNMIRLAGEVADGVMLWLCCPSYIAGTVIPALRRASRPRGAPSRTSTSSPRCPPR